MFAGRWHGDYWERFQGFLGRYSGFSVKVFKRLKTNGGPLPPLFKKRQDRLTLSIHNTVIVRTAPQTSLSLPEMMLTFVVIGSWVPAWT
jgi:hypothetical protein